MPRSPRACTAVAAAALAILLTGAAAPAQQVADGLRAGSFVIAPSVTVVTGYESNLFRTASRPTGTLRVSLAPDVTIASDWSRHALRLEASADAGTYAASTEDSYLDARVRLSGELDVTRRLRLRLSAGAAREHDPRSSRDVPAGLAEPVRFAAFDIRLEAEAEIGRLRIAPFAAGRRYDFHDAPLSAGGLADQDSRDRREAEAGIELGYAPGRAWEVVVRAGVFDIAYRGTGSTAGPARDATGVAALAGVRLKLTRLIEGRITAGIVRHDYDAPVFADITTLAIDATLDWRPTRRIAVQARAGRSVAETAVAGAAGRIATRGGLRVGYELLRTLVAGAGVSLTHDRYRGIARSDLGFALGADLDWSPMRGVSIRPDYRFERLDSDTAGQGHTAHVFTLSATYSFGARK